MNSNQPRTTLLLTSPLTRFLWEPPFDSPQYNGQHNIGIMRQKCNRRVIWRFVHRDDGLPLFNMWFDEARHFSHGFAAVRRSEKWHFITSEGKVACRHRFLEVGMVDSNGQVPVLHPTYVQIGTKRPIWTIYTFSPLVERNP